jgi:phosphoribosylformylglycinamidine synthase
MFPIAHGEGRFVTDSPETLEALIAHNQVALTYADNPNGSSASIAGICDPSGRIFGLMPHPERYLDWSHHPFWTRLDAHQRRGDTPGMRMFRNAVEAAKRVRV